MTQYINKSALVAEIERRMTPECGYTLNKLLDYIDTLEVKEVQEEPVSEDLEEAIGQSFNQGLEMADAGKDERYSDHRTGFNYGYEIYEDNIQQFNDFLNTIFKEKYNTMFVVQLAAECYEKQRKIKEFEELAVNAWHIHKKLWDTINDFSTQWGETDRMKLINRYNLSFKADDEETNTI